MVREDQVPPELPDAAGRPDPRHGTGGPLRQSGLLSGAELKAAVLARAAVEGFAVARVTTPDAIPEAESRLQEWLAAGHQGTMGWMGERAGQRGAPSALWPQVRSIIMLGTSYAPDCDPLEALLKTSEGAISVYAQRRDYHDVIKGRLKSVAGLLAARGGVDVKVFVDTAPVMEKPLAAAAGLGWQGKHTVLVARAHGSWLFLGAIYTTAELPPDAPETDHCGSCTRCLDICPTDAFPAPYQLDSRRCIAYLTIEHVGHIEAQWRAAIGNRIFGCDDCLAVCPWNKFAEAANETRLGLRPELAGLPLAELAALDDAAFRKLFADTPVKRTGRDRFVRNVMIAIGNSGDAALVEVAVARLRDASPLVRAMAIWALAQLDDNRLGAEAHLSLTERDAGVLQEWTAATGWKDTAS